MKEAGELADSSTDSQVGRYSRRTRSWLVGLLIVTALFAGGALYLKYKLENLRATVQGAVESRTGARLRVGSVVVNGLRGLRLDDVEVGFEADSGPSVRVSAPSCFIHINMVDLLYGTVSVDRVVADRSTIRVERRLDGPWLAPGGFKLAESESLLNTGSFRLTGSNSTLEMVNVVGESRLTVTGFNFDISRLEDSPDITGKFSGRLAQDASKEAKVDLRFTSFEDFDLRMECGGVGAGDLAVFLPSSEGFIESGVMAPSVRVAGYPNNTLIVAFETRFRDVVLQNQPGFLMPAEGTLTGVAAYDSATRLLTLTGAKAESNQVAGRIEGSVSFAEALPSFDLRFNVTQLPLADVLDYSMTGRASEYGVLDIKLEEPYELQLALQGTTEAPLVSMQGNISGGEFSFEPKDAGSPRGKLRLGMMKLSWNSGSLSPSGSFSVVDGTLSHSGTGLIAEKLAGVLTVGENRVAVDSLTAEIGGNPFVGSIKYDFSANQLELSASGVLPGIEALVPEEALNGLRVKGPVNVRCNVVRTPGKTVGDADVDATQAEVAYQWWFLKPAGIGARCSGAHIELLPGKTLKISGKVGVASSEFEVEGQFAAVGKSKWAPRVVKATAAKADVDALGKCILVPYKITGGTASGLKLDWAQKGAKDPWTLRGEAQVDELSLLSQSNEIPMQFTGLDFGAEIVDVAGSPGRVRVAAKKAVLPPLRSKWFVSLGVPDEEKKKYRLTERKWELDLAGENVQIDHWKGTGFKGKAYIHGNEAGLSAFRAGLEGGGQINGAYRRFRDDNRGELTFKWAGIEAGYLTRQLGYGGIFTGTTSGEIGYSLDSDDPGTLKGAGNVQITDGQVSADYVVSKLEGQLQEHITSLPVSLKFKNFKTDIGLEGDQVTTNNLSLESNGINVTGNGKFYHHGDVDYSLKVSLTPDLAEKIPALRDNMNVQGLRLAQQNVDLAFNVKGPIFNPQAELSSLPPVHVTVVSSALEVTSDAMKVLDIPRKILVDLLKIGGGLVGMTK
ncbi:MAG: hypothetical protein NTZ09_18080 [Candidatus Hydrogenedentes bacterium]|nr:hypothetical protein [Candidatus Hydrogenedentota bacterium]